MMPLEQAVSALGNRLAAQPAAPQPAAPSAAGSSQFCGTPAENTTPAPTQSAAAEATESAGEAAAGGEDDGRLKFDFNALNKRAIENSQRLAKDYGTMPKFNQSADKSAGDGRWFGKGKTVQDANIEGENAHQDDDWAAEALA